MDKLELKSMWSEKGKKLLLLGNFKFSKAHVAKNGRTRWRCTNRDCVSKIYTDGDETIILEAIINHNHGEDCTINRQIVSNRIKRKALNDLTEMPLKLIRRELENNDISTPVISKDLECIRRNIYCKRWRRNVSHPFPRNQDDGFVTILELESKLNKTEELKTGNIKVEEISSEKENVFRPLSVMAPYTFNFITGNKSSNYSAVGTKLQDEIKVEETSILEVKEEELPHPLNEASETIAPSSSSSIDRSRVDHDYDLQDCLEKIMGEKTINTSSDDSSDASSSHDATSPVKRRPSTSTAAIILNQNAERDDEFDLLGKIIASKLRRFPKDVRIISEKLLNEVLFLAEIRSLNTKSRIVSD